jgi:stage III sporulation protein SpoIIIAA
MSDVNRDLFPTSRINVPNLVPLMERLRDESLRRSVTLLHARTSEEGEWICSTASARLARENVQRLAPQDGKVIDVIEQAIRSKMPIVFVGEIRREEDARALRAAATLGIRTVGFLVRETRREAEDTLAMLGGWNSFDVALLSEYPD